MQDRNHRKHQGGLPDHGSYRGVRHTLQCQSEYPEDTEEGNWYDVLETDSEGNITRVAVDDRAPDLQDELPRQYANERGKTIEWNGVTYE
ncbi:MAG: hypothetical protein MdMp014T_0209 [Treponematales bacterium]